MGPGRVAQMSHDRRGVRRMSNIDGRFVRGLRKIDDGRGGNFLGASIIATAGVAWCDVVGLE